YVMQRLSEKRRKIPMTISTQSTRDRLLLSRRHRPASIRIVMYMARRSAGSLFAITLCFSLTCWQSGLAQEQRSTDRHGRHTVNPSTMPQNISDMDIPNAQLADKALNKKVEALLAKMTLEEKVGQLVQFSSGEATGPGTGRQGYDTMIAAGEVGSLLNVADAKKANAFQHVAIEKSRLHIPLLYGFDVIHGYRTIFPVPLGMASSFDPPLVRATARIAAQEASADGIRW